MSGLNAFQYMGSKLNTLPFLYRNFPKNYQKMHFVDVFGGSGVVTFNKPLSALETYNDLNSNVVRFFTILREDYETAINAIGYTPFNREEYDIAAKTLSGGGGTELSDSDFARYWYLLFNGSFNGSIEQGGSFKTIIDPNGANPAVNYFNKQKKLKEISKRLSAVQIENKPYSYILQKYDRESTFFYCDPPYVLETRTDKTIYKRFDFTDNDQKRFLKQVKALSGKVMVSNYDNDLYNDSLLDDGWRKLADKEKVIASSKLRRSQSEIIYVNY